MRAPSSALVVPLVSLLLTAGAPPAAARTIALSNSGHNVESAWDASFGPGGGTAAIRVLDTGTGSLKLSANRLSPLTTYQVVLVGGRCPATGSRLVSFGKLTTDKTGKLIATQSLDGATVAVVRAAAAGTGRVSIAVGSGSKAACGTFAKSLDVTPRIWFAPLPPLPIEPWRPYIGSTDFSALFFADSPWSRASGRSSVFKFYMEWAAWDATDQELRQAVAALQARDIAIAIEVAPLVPPDDGSCGTGVEGFGGGPEETLDAIQRVEAAGGRVSFLALDEPFFFASSLYGGPGACNWSRDKIAADVAAYTRAIRAARPAILIGDIEPLAGPATAQAYEGWMDAYVAAAGSPLPFFHLDVDYPNRSDWVSSARELQAHAQGADTRFGIIYNGPYDSPTDAAWLSDARNHLLEYETEGAVPPDDAIFQSWTDHPDSVLPETAPTTFTHLIVDYTRQRTTLAVNAPTTAGDGRFAIDGSLATLGASPIGGAAIDVTVTPRDGPYQLLEYGGTVPPGATQAVIGLRLNLEGSGPGLADLTVYEIGYAEGGDPTNRVPNPSYADGLDYWSPWGDTTTFTVVTSDRDPAAAMLRIVATPDQSAGSNSGAFPVTAGESYRLWLRIRVPQTSVGSMYVAPIFLNDAWDEISRSIDYPAPAPIPAGSTMTGVTGAFLLTTPALETGRYHLTASYSGDAALWPARTETEVVLP